MKEKVNYQEFMGRAKAALIGEENALFLWRIFAEWEPEFSPAKPDQPENVSSEQLVIVPSGRIDYCCECKKDHGYDCPLDQPKPEEWEGELQFCILEDYLNEAEKNPGFLKRGHAEHLERMRGHFGKLKDFIRTQLQKEYERGRKEGKKYGYEVGVSDEGDRLEVKLKQARTDTLNDVEKIVEGEKILCLEDHRPGDKLPYCEHESDNRIIDSLLHRLQELRDI